MPVATMHQAATITGNETRPAVRVPIPGPESKRTIALDEEFLATTTKTSPITGRVGRGAVVLDEDGNVLLDFTSGIGVTNTGHSHPAVVRAVQEQAAELIHFAGTDFYYRVQSELGRDLDAIVPGDFAKKTFFANSGTEANEAAIKLVRWNTRRPLLLAFTHAFHGRTQGSLSLTASKPVHKERFTASMPGVSHVPFPNPYRNPFRIDGYADPAHLTSVAIGLVEDLLEGAAPATEVGAMFVEPVQGEGGYIVPPRDFYPQLKKVLDAHGIHMVADEVQTGFGRTGRMFAMEHFGIAPAITTMAKAMGSGVPIGACVFDARLDFGTSGAHSNTFGGNLLAAAAARATIRVLREEKLVERAQKMGDVLGRGLQELRPTHPGIGDVRGLGLMWALEFVKDPKSKAPDKATRDRVLEQAWKRGLLLLPCGGNSIRVIPPLVTSKEQIEGGLAVLREALLAAKP